MTPHQDSVFISAPVCHFRNGFPDTMFLKYCGL